MSHLLGYIRVSTEGQRDGFGLDVQEAAIQRYASANGLQIIKIYRDEGVSGALKDRPALIELMGEADRRKGEELTLAFLRLDRLARDLLVQESLISDFQRKGLKVVSIDEPDLCSNDPTRKLFRQMKGMLAEYEKSMITLRMSAGRLKKVELGRGYAGGNVAYGFRARAGRYKKVPDELEVVKTIFKLRRKPKLGRRWGYQRIADYLNLKAVTAPRGNRWYAMTVRYVHKNQFYRGIQGYSSVRFNMPNIKVI